MGIDGHIQQQIPMLVADLGKHDMIIGRLWFSENDVLLDCRRRRMIWPHEVSLFEEVASKIALPTPITILKNPRNLTHQKDADRRDKILEQSIDPYLDRNGGRFPSPRHHQKGQWRAKDIEKMQRNLDGTKSPELSGTLDINSKTEVFATSLSEIDSILEVKSSSVSDDPEMDEILRVLPAEYHDLADVFLKRKSDELPPHRKGVDHDIVLEAEAQPGYCPLYKLSTQELQEAKKYILANLDKGFIVPSSAPYASPILMARKPGGGLRFCVDYRRLNALTKKDCYPLPLIDEVLQRTSKAKFFTKVDMQQGFHRIRMTPDAEDLTTFRTRYGSFKYKVLPFGLTNGPATFQRFMNDVLRECMDEYAIAFVDDVLIYSENEEDHRRHVREVLRRLRAAGLQVGIKKCEFSVQQTKFIGFIVSTDGISVDPEKIRIIEEWTSPDTVRGIQSFLGFCNFYRRFIRNYSKISKPLHRLTRKDTPWDWDDNCEGAFQELKNALLSAPILRHYDHQRLTRVETDASDGVLGAVLTQYYEEDDFWHPVAFYSKVMQQAELHYEIRDKELLAIVRALQEWRPELLSLTQTECFGVVTDHQSLEYFMKNRQLNQRQMRWSEFLSQFHFMIKYRPGKKNIIADVLSRKDAPCLDDSRQAVLLPESCFEDPGRDPDADPVQISPLSNEIAGNGPDGSSIVERVKHANRNDQSLNEFREMAGAGSPSWSIDDDGLLLYNGKLEVSDQDDLRARLLDEMHRQPLVAHPGIEKLKKLVSARYHWHGWASDIKRYVDNCLICKRTKAWRDKTPGLLHPIENPNRPWEHLTMDFRSFPKDKNGFDAVFVIVYRLSKRPVSIPCHKETTAKKMARLFINNVIRITGIPVSIISDRGGQFISEFWTEFCRILGIERRLSSAHHPETDGQSEIANQYMAQRLCPYIEHNQDDWSDYLPMVDFAASILPQETTRKSPFFVERGYEPVMSFDWRDRSTLTENEQEASDMLARLHEIWNETKEQATHSQGRQAQQANRHRREVDFDVGDLVFVTTKDWLKDRPSRKLSDVASGPYKIIKKEGFSFKLDLPPSIKVHPVFHASKLRKASTTEPLRGQHSDHPPPIQVGETDEWEVEKILDAKLRYRKLVYRVQWLGHDVDLTWYPAGNFKNSADKIEEFHDNYPSKPGPPLRLQAWKDAAMADQLLEDHPDDDKV
ncbi:retrovirus polyprotein [Penicillium bovifimosum]|uniref:Retrovirus polyprotein n=1 Tax=Penicillium bovifimosum TaxID=126998 RepID=A0A9W9GZX9_9EURO|nr:retrovirus polyprotein [Penicillium bovifimosum]KAJ5134995.1 retrovirus polyprotein [Penicillium bovifimosum]